MPAARQSPDLRPPAASRPHQPAFFEDHALPAPAIPHHHAKPSKSRRRSFSVLAVILVLVAAGGFFYHQHQTKIPVSAAPAIPLPASVSSKVNFPIYYPSPTPAGYTYSQGSTTVQSGLVFYKMFNGSKFVFFTEQASPPRPVDLSALPNYKQFAVPAGTAALGTNLDKPAGLVVTKNTLINVSSAGGASADDLTALLHALTPLKH
jgi:hypothetical protein